MKDYSKKIESLRLQKVVDPERVAILYCPPLSKRKFAVDKNFAWWFSLIGRTKDFVKAQPSWKLFEQREGAFILSALARIRKKSGSKVFIHPGFGAFKRVLHNDQYDAIFLVAHHIQKEGGKSKIEFSTGGVQSDKVIHYLEKVANTRELPPLVFLVCNSEKFGQSISENSAFTSPVGIASWKIPLKGGVWFLENWIRHLNGRNSLYEAYLLGIREVNLKLKNQM